MTNLLSEISTPHCYKQKQKYKNKAKISHFYNLFPHAPQKNQISDDEIFQTTCFTRPIRPSVKN